MAAVVALAVGSVAGVARGQVNAEALRLTLKKNPQFVWLDGSVVTRTGNTRGGTLSGSLFGGITRRPHLFFGKAAADYGTASGAVAVARALAHVRYNYETTETLSLELLAQVQHDHFRRLAVRDLYGTGLRWNFLRTDPLEFFAGQTALLEQEVISSSAEFPGTSDTHGRSSTYAGFNVAVLDLGELNTVTYVQPRLDHPTNVRVLSDTILTLAISKRLATKIGFNLWYESEPAPGVRPTDVEVRTSLAVKL